MIRHTGALCWILLCLLNLSACGFHLRGEIVLPSGAQPIYVTGNNPNGELVRSIITLLNNANIDLADNGIDARHSLVILSETSDRRTATVSANSTTAEYQLTTTATFKVLDSRQQVVIPPTEITERRILNNRQFNVTASDQEELIIRREMLDNLSLKIARRLRTLQQENALPAAS